MKKVISWVFIILYVATLVLLYLGICNYNWIPERGVELLAFAGGGLILTSILILVLLCNNIDKREDYEE